MNNTILKISKKVNLSPLRYPGGKRKLAPLIADIFARHGEPIQLLVEPFAGGASTSISFLESNLAQEIALSDRDQLVATFWKVVFSPEAEALADLVATCNVSLRTWKALKEEVPGDDIGIAFKCLFMNRTNFSGILHENAGPIGGIAQSGSYKLDCRFNQESLAIRILELSRLRNRVRFVRCQSYKKTISDVKRMNISKGYAEKLFWYLDPPFFEKANYLYRVSFSEIDHVELKNILIHDSIPGQWLLSYDDVKAARSFYSNHKGFSRVNLSYNARIDSFERLRKSEIIVSNIIEKLRINRVPGIPAMGKIIPLHGFSARTEKMTESKVINYI
ncbi:DNA adenine methylase [Hahella sp. HN01]|uniref:DNA adenine methylase n=1 Tax=Hahella sp. HN01 TaxID=2847262 RepID=UPI001C1F1042|nr:DNA adenine methylase [Hahella sp. HN01]MBU6952619.1 DNA adenine methylase [Hahella sp. HN01]